MNLSISAAFPVHHVKMGRTLRIPCKLDCPIFRHPISTHLQNEPTYPSGAAMSPEFSNELNWRAIRSRIQIFNVSEFCCIVNPIALWQMPDSQSCVRPKGSPIYSANRLISHLLQPFWKLPGFQNPRVSVVACIPPFESRNHGATGWEEVRGKAVVAERPDSLQEDGRATWYDDPIET